jgi:cell division protein FtsI/penicillin-binding protein 2
VISEETSDTVKEILESVVTTGTGKNAYVAGTEMQENGHVRESV